MNKRDKEILRKYILENKSLREIGKEIGVSRQTVLTVIAKYGLSDVRRRLYRELSVEEKKQILYEYIVEGKWLQDICRKLHRTERQVATWLKEFFGVKNLYRIKKFYQYSLIAKLLRKHISPINVAYITGLFHTRIRYIAKTMGIQLTDGRSKRYYMARNAVKQWLEKHKKINDAQLRRIITSYGCYTPRAGWNILLDLERTGHVKLGVKELVTKMLGGGNADFLHSN
jgi:predicted DNA-binding protein YlxM (UPF0122 family)